MGKIKVRGVFFDLDGTLVDSAGDLASSVNHALNIIDKPNLDEATIRSYIGNGADRLIHRAITGNYDGEADSDLYSPARQAFLSHYAANVCEKSTLYPGVENVLTTLGNDNYQLACITNKPQQFTHPLLARLGVAQYFPLVLAGDSLQRKKPEPDQLEHAAQFFGISPGECVMIGDTNTDIAAALNCDMSAIFVTYGYGEESDLDTRFSGPHIDVMDELHDHIS
ncbi:MAG: phosphoglycolate phosphatase [Gammaproteobacteria bacterium]